jgi:O-antigen ligase
MKRTLGMIGISVNVSLIALPLLGGGNYIFELSPLWGNAILFLTVPLILLLFVFTSPKDGRSVSLHWSDGLLGAFVLLMVLSYFYSRSRSDSWMALLLFLGSISLAYLIRFSARDFHSLEKLAKMILLSSFGVVAYEFYQSFWKFGEIAKTVSLQSGARELVEHFQLYRNPYSTFMTSNLLACYLVMLVPISFYFLILENRNSGGYKWSSFLGLISLSLFMTASKGGILTYSILTLLIIIFIYRYDRANFNTFLKKISLSIFVAFFLTVILWNFTWKPEGMHSIQSELSMFSVTPDKFESSSTGRIHYWETAYQMWMAHWLIGSGIGTYPVLNPEYQKNVYYSKHAHDDYLEILAESGIIGLTLFVAFVAILIFLAVRDFITLNGNGEEIVFSQIRSPQILIGVCLILSLSGFLIHSAVDFNWEIPANRTLFLILLMMLASLRSILLSEFSGRNKRLIQFDFGNWVGKGAVILFLVFQWVSIPNATIAQSYLELAIDTLGENRLKAISFAEESSALFPRDYRYHLFLAKAYREKWRLTAFPKDLATAFYEGERTVSLQPEIAEGHGELATLYFLRGDYIKAETEWKMALAKGNKNLKYYNYLGEYYIAQMDYDKARNILTQGELLAMEYQKARQVEMRNEGIRTALLLKRLDNQIGMGNDGNH